MQTTDPIPEPRPASERRTETIPAKLATHRVRAQLRATQPTSYKDDLRFVESGNLIDLEVGQRHERLVHAMQTYRVRHQLSEREFAVQCRMSDGSVVQVESRVYPRITVDLFTRLAEGMCMTGEELRHLMESDVPLKRIDQAEVALLHYQIHLTPQVMQRLATNIEAFMGTRPESRRHIKGTAEACGVSTTVVSNLLKLKQIRIGRDILIKLCRAMNLSPTDMLRESES